MVGRPLKVLTQVIRLLRLHSTGNLSVKTDISGAYTNGNTITPTIFWVDQYGNAGTGSITINVTDNQNPTASFTNANLNCSSNN